MLNVYKSTPVELLDNFFARGPNLAKNLKFASVLLDDESQSLLDITGGVGGRQELTGIPGQAEGFQSNWRGRLGDEVVDNVMRGAYRKAVALASERIDLAQHEDALTAWDSDNCKPIETFWISDVGGEYEMHVSKSARQITVFVVFPLSRELDEVGSRIAQSESFAFRGGQDGVVEGEKVSGRNGAATQAS